MQKGPSACLFPMARAQQSVLSLFLFQRGTDQGQRPKQSKVGESGCIGVVLWPEAFLPEVK